MQSFVLAKQDLEGRWEPLAVVDSDSCAAMATNDALWFTWPADDTYFLFKRRLGESPWHELVDKGGA